MAGGFKKFLDFIKLGTDEDDIMDDDFYEDEEEEQTFSRRSKRTNQDEVVADRRTSTITSSESGVQNTRSRVERGSNKVVQMKTIRGMEVCIRKPASFEDSEELCDMLLKGQAVVVNLEGFDSADAQRIIDLLYGCVYAIGGKLNQIAKYIFIFSPNNIDVLGDISIDMNGVPTFNNEF